MITIRRSAPSDLQTKVLDAAGYQGQWCNIKAEANTDGSVGKIEPVNAAADAQKAKEQLGVMLWNDLDVENATSDSESIAAGEHVIFLNGPGFVIEDHNLDARTPEIDWSAQTQDQLLDLTVSGWPVPADSAISATSATNIARFSSYQNGIVSYETI